MSEQILLDDEYWLVKTLGPRYFTARSKCHDEHRIYYSRDGVELDFGNRLQWPDSVLTPRAETE
jgi:hypothetical protein